MMNRIKMLFIIALPVAILAGMLGLVIAGGNESVQGSYTTSLEGRSESQIHNIRLAMKAIDGTVIRPGEVFSFNGTVKERSSAEGYVVAPTIIEGRLEDSSGGGICQVSSTLYNAALLAGLRIVERHSHTSTVSSVPPGRDATVVFGGSDLRFENTNFHPLTVRASVSGDRLIMRIVGEGRRPSEYRIAVDSEDSIRPMRTQFGSRGIKMVTATVWREELQGSEVVGREFVSSDTYMSAE